MDSDPNGHTEVSGWDLSVLDCGLLEGRDGLVRCASRAWPAAAGTEQVSVFVELNGAQ